MNMAHEITDAYFIQNELLNIRNVIQLTKDNISALNAKFSELQHPPVMYFTEHEELSSKLQELEIKACELVEQLKISRRPSAKITDRSSFC